MEEISPLSLDVESVLKFKLDNGRFHIWPLVRFDLLTALSREGSLPAPRRSVPMRARIGNLLKGLLGIRFSRAPIQFISSTLFCVKQSHKYRNVLEDYFCQVCPKGSFVYENLDPLDYSRRLPRENPKISTVFTYIDLIGKALALFFKVNVDNDIDAFCQHLVDQGVAPSLVDNVRVKLVRYAKQLSMQRLLYRLFLKLCSPKLLFVNCGAYGASNAILISEAKSLGIAIAEMQHGVIDASHYAYNYNAEMRESSVYERYLPDYLLTFGEFWHGGMCNACVKVPVGHPHLSRIREKFVDKSLPDSFLVISQWTITDDLIEAAVKLRAARPNAQIKYRLHPIEALSDQQRQRLLANDIELSDRHSDIYAEFSSSWNIVGCYSTALYEAKAFGKNVLVMKHPLAFQYGFDKVGTVFELPTDLNNGVLCNRSSRDVSVHFYQADFDRCYMNFLSPYIKEA